MKKNNLDSLLLDLTNIVEYNENGRSYKIWEKPQIQENIDWFTSKGKEKNISLKLAAHNDELLAERLQCFIDKGLDLKNKAYVIASVNSPRLLQKALDNGADPNIIFQDLYDKEQALIDFTISRGMNNISKLIIEDERFNFEFKSGSYPNLLFKCVAQHKFHLAYLIAQKKPDLIIDNKNMPSIAYFMSDYLEGSDQKDNILEFVEYCANYSYSKNIPFNINEIHNGKTLLEKSPEVASVIKKVETEYLNKELNSNFKNNTKKIKI